MKRGKDDEKIMGPMFPRLHVNDTEKGGPRAPPRNKMALYEQLSIPSQRSTPGRLPLNSNNASNLVPPASSSQGNGQRSVFFPVHLPHSIPTQAEKVHTPQTDRINSNSPLGQLEQRKKVGDEDDFMVPIFVHSEMGQSQSKIQNSLDEGKLTPFSPTYSGRSIRIENSSDKDLEKTSSTGPVLRQEIRSQNDISPAEYISSRHHSVKSPANLSRGDKMDKSVKQANVPRSQENEGPPASRHDRLHDTDAHSREQYGAQSQMEDTECDADVVDNHPGDMEKGHAFRQRSISCLGETGISDKSDDASETSMVDSVSGLDISPDDVVGIIGRKHFWKARRAIVNQQRVFAVQVFELHRLIKVQRSIAGSPHLLIEDSAYLGNPPLKGSPVKKLSAEYVIKSPPHIVKRNDDLEKPDRKMEYSAENAVGKTSVSSVKNGSQPSNYGPYLSNLPPATDTRMSPWGFSQPPGHQWLVPVLSPSEGLIYKPYPGPGFLGTACGGYGPMGQAHLTSNFINPSYGIPGSHHHHQGIGVIPGASPVGHDYFPPYGMPVMNPATISDSAVEQMNQFIGPESQGHSGQLASVNMQQQQSSCNLSSRKNGDISQVAKFPPSKDSELQGSTASCPSGKAQGSAMGHAAKGRDRDALPLFPTTPAIPEGEFQPLDTEQAARVIRVVPHNPSSATESAARIFQSIQEERKQFDSI